MQTQLAEFTQQAESDLRINTLISTLKEQRDAAYNIMVNQSAELKVAQTKANLSELNVKNLLKELTDSDNIINQLRHELAEKNVLILNLQSQLNTEIPSEDPNDSLEGSPTSSDSIINADKGDSRIKKIKS